ncbi:MAG TPA: ECF-type sigma factor [Terriglobales bacterium]|nr:ECF-type sigma factor [Terriglobales bacterium]
MDSSYQSLSALVEAAECGDGSATGELFSALYSELYRLARHELLRHGAPISISAGTLLHQAYLDMAARNGDAPRFPDQGRFMAYAARVMRGLIIDHARSRCARKRGGQFEITSLAQDMEPSGVDGDDLARISEALDELAKIDPGLAQMVDLKFFCGFSFDEIAQMQGLSPRTVRRKWEKARLYLYESISADLSA